MKGAVYDVSSGRITRTIDCPENIVGGQLGYGEAVFVLPDDYPDGIDETHYINDGGIAEKLPLALQHEPYNLSSVIEGVPPGSLVLVEDVEVFSDSTTVEVEFDAPGTYEIRIYPPPQYRDEVLEVTVG